MLPGMRMLVRERLVTPEFWAIIGVGVTLGLGMVRRFGRLNGHVRARGERLARLEGKVDALIATFVKPEAQA